MIAEEELVVITDTETMTKRSVGNASRKLNLIVRKNA